MDELRWKKAKDLFHEALDRAVDKRASFLDAACGDDVELREKVDQLLASNDSDFLRTPASDQVVEIIGSDHRLEPGQEFGRYRIVKLIGSGGMGEVYLANDAELDRQVALKLLRSDVVDDKERVIRFIREARAASALNHPNILTIHDVSTFEDSRFIVSEYVDGVTLRERMHSGLRPAECVDITCQIAAALQAAHAAGIVHRDIKPENVMIRRDGLVKVLDFGLAKLTEADDLPIDPNAKPASRIHTTPGLVMGTVAYMSPEQARGQSVDARSDLWSLGVVFHEMLTGQSPFEGESVTDLITSILKTDKTTVNDERVPPELRPICRKALIGDKTARYQSADDLLRDLQGEKKRMEYAIDSTPYITAAGIDGLKTELIRRRPTLSAEYIVTSVKRHKYATLAAVFFVITGAVGLSVYRYNGATPPSSEQSLVAIEPNTTERDLKFSRLSVSADAHGAVISPDGKYVAYAARDVFKDQVIRLLNLETNEDTVVLSDPNFWNITFSPDSKFIYYSYGSYESTDGFKRVSIHGGAPVKVVDKQQGDVNGPTFSPDGTTMVFTRDEKDRQTIQLADLDGSNERTIAKVSPDNWIFPALFSPDGKTLAAPMRFKEGGTYWKLMRFTVADGKSQALSDKKWASMGFFSVWLPNGNLVITAKEIGSDTFQLWSIPPGGEPKAITSGLVNYGTLSATKAGDTLLALQASVAVDLWMLPDNDAGKAKRMTSSGEVNGRFAWTPDGRIVITSNVSSNPDIWIMNADGTGRKRLTQDPAPDAQPAVSSDGKYIAFTSQRVNGVPHIFRMDLDGNNPKQLTSGSHERLPSFSPDGKWVYYVDADGDPPATMPTVVRKVSINGGETSIAATAPEGWGLNGIDVNRADGRLVYGLERFAQDKLQFKLAIVPAQGGEPRLIDVPANLVSRRPFWTPDGYAIALRSPKDGTDIWSVPVDGTGQPKQLTDFRTPGTTDFGWSFDGKQLLVSRVTSISSPVLIRNIGK